MGIVVLADVRDLHAELTLLLRHELDAGNLVDDTWRGWPTPNTICVKLTRSFLPKTLEAATDSLMYLAVNDPHYWREEILHKPSGHLLITGYDQFEHRNAAT